MKGRPMIWVGGLATAAAIVVSLQAISYPWAPSALVAAVSENTASIITIEKRDLARELLRNRIMQKVYEEDGETVPDLYLEQELDFKERIEELDRELKSLKR